MRIYKRKKGIFILLIVVLVLLSISLLLYLIVGRGKKHNLPEEPVSIEQFGESDLPIEISIDSNVTAQYAPVYTIKNTFYEKKIKNMIDESGLNLTKSDMSDINYIEWEGDGNRFTYNSISNTFTFELAEPIYLGSEDQAFKEVFLKYFEKDYEFNISKREVVNSNLTNYYSRRIVSDIPLERGYGYEYSDILRFDKSGDVSGGSLLLADIEIQETNLPIMSTFNLIKYVNQDDYPKESYVYASQIIDTVDISYLDPRWQEIHESASNCTSNNIELIYLYKSVNQEFLYPSFKVSATCEVLFEEDSYFVPAIFYLNAIDPEYVKTNQ